MGKVKAKPKARRAPASARVVNGITVVDDAMLVKVSDLKPFDRNPNTHPEEQVRALSAWMLEVGFIVPILLDKNFTIIEGHGRVMAAERLEMDRVPALFARHLSPKQVRAHVVAGNQLARMAKVDPMNLKSLMQEIRLDYPDVRVVGFTDADMRKLSAEVKAMLPGHDGEVPDPDARTRARGERVTRGEDDEEEGDDPDSPADVDLEPFSVMLSEDDLAELHAAVRKVKERDDVTLTSVALLTIVREWGHA